MHFRGAVVAEGNGLMNGWVIQEKYSCMSQATHHIS